MAYPVVLAAPIALYRGDSRTLEFHFWSDAAKTIPVNLTTYGTIFTGNIRTAPDATLVEAMTLDTTNVSTGVLSIVISPAQWTALAGNAQLGWDVQVTDSATAPTEVTTLIRGTFTVTLDYTHD